MTWNVVVIECLVSIYTGDIYRQILAIESTYFHKFRVLPIL
jgi:hypothetical protein